MSRARLALGGVAFVAVFAVISARIVGFAVADSERVSFRALADASTAASRPDITDRNGKVLATDVVTPSLYAEPKKIIDVDEAVELLTAAMPNLDQEQLRTRLDSDRSFVWLKREVTPAQEALIHDLGIPGVGFRREFRRVYPTAQAAAHIVGHVNVDNRGIAGIEKYLDDRGLADLHGLGFGLDSGMEAVDLSIDLRVQHALRDELWFAQEKFSALAAAGVVLDAKTGEVVAMVSLPDYDPNRPETSLDEEAINRLTTGVYEMGSTFKPFTVAMALDTGRITMNDRYDASRPLRVGRQTINDYRGKNRVLSVPEIFIYSSNIGTARMALDVGMDEHQAFLERLALSTRLRTELPESAPPMVPRKWKQVNAMTISFGHGISVAPLQMAAAAAPLVNGGLYHEPTFMPRTETEALESGRRVLRPQTSDAMRHLFRLNTTEGTARKADRPGYRVGGKTGTAEKVVNGRYAKDKRLTSFLGTFPTDDPHYIVLVMLDEPKGIPETHGWATSGWNAAPTAGRVIERIAPILGVLPRREDTAPEDASEQPLFVSY
ncbi:MAG: penicillin-binding protein 2 [Pseudomonadota bacterium]